MKSDDMEEALIVKEEASCAFFKRYLIFFCLLNLSRHYLHLLKELFPNESGHPDLDLDIHKQNLKVFQGIYLESIPFLAILVIDLPLSETAHSAFRSLDMGKQKTL